VTAAKVYSHYFVEGYHSKGVGRYITAQSMILWGLEPIDKNLALPGLFFARKAQDAENERDARNCEWQTVRKD
jgi:hypothetical protein